MESKTTFDPEGIGLNNGNLFGLPFEYEDAQIVVIPVPWEVTASYGQGTAEAPQSILEASMQVELYDPEYKDPWQAGIYLQPPPDAWEKWNNNLRPKAGKVMEHLEKGGSTEDEEIKSHLSLVNEGSALMVEAVRAESEKVLEDGKMPVILGGDHSVPLGLIQALANRHDGFGVLQFDAHADLRESYEGFEYSHASIMHNYSLISQVESIVAVGLRDYSSHELKIINAPKGKYSAFFDHEIQDQMHRGTPWDHICEVILKSLPDQLYISFDIDGLDPVHCPNTGTPVPGGLSFTQATHLLKKISASGRQIIGFDLCEVASQKWDAIVGARMLYKLIGAMLRSNA